MLCRHHGLQTSRAGQLWNANFVLPAVFLSSSSKTGGRVCNSLYFSPDDGRSSLSSTSKPNEEILLNFWDRKRRKRVRGWEKTLSPPPLLPLDLERKKGALAQLCSPRQGRTLESRAGWSVLREARPEQGISSLHWWPWGREVLQGFKRPLLWYAKGQRQVPHLPGAMEISRF